LGIADRIVEAVALHHYPTRFLSKQFCPLTAVHVANAFEYELRKDKAKLPGAMVDSNYLTDLQVADRVDAWRDACQENALSFEFASTLRRIHLDPDRSPRLWSARGGARQDLEWTPAVTDAAEA
jgi:hypothetical protein